jgi:hypothetical protein
VPNETSKADDVFNELAAQERGFNWSRLRPWAWPLVSLGVLFMAASWFMAREIRSTGSELMLLALIIGPVGVGFVSLGLVLRRLGARH